MNFKSILVAINHSPLTSVVFDRALNLVQQEQAKLMILHCLVDLTAIDPGLQFGRFGLYPINTEFSQSFREETLQREIEQAKTWLQEYCDRATSLNISTPFW